MESLDRTAKTVTSARSDRDGETLRKADSRNFRDREITEDEGKHYIRAFCVTCAGRVLASVAISACVICTPGR